MFWEKKKKEDGLPDLPRPPARPSLPQRDFMPIEDDFEDEKIHELPSFPDSPMQKGFSQSAIKEAVANEEIKEEDRIPDLKMPLFEEHKRIGGAEENYSGQAAHTLYPAGKRESKPIFVRIDKFQLARNSLETVKEKLAEIEDLLKTIRDVKAKEDVELSSWEAEMENAKSRVQNVLNDIFERAEI